MMLNTDMNMYEHSSEKRFSGQLSWTRSKLMAMSAVGGLGGCLDEPPTLKSEVLKNVLLRR